MSKFLLFVCLLLSFSACGDTSDSKELQTLRAESETLKAPTATISNGGNTVEEVWIELQLDELDELGIPGITRDEGECTLKDFVGNIGLDTARNEFQNDDASEETLRAFYTSLFGCTDYEKNFARAILSDPDSQEFPIEYIECATGIASKDPTLLIDLMMLEETEDTSLQAETLRAFYTSLLECTDIRTLMKKALANDPETQEIPPEVADCMIRILENDSELTLDFMMLQEDASDEDFERLMNSVQLDFFACISKSLSSIIERELLKDPGVKGEPPEFKDCMLRTLANDPKLTLDFMMLPEDAIDEDSERLKAAYAFDFFGCVGDSFTYEEFGELFNVDWNDYERLNFVESCEKANSDLPEFQAKSFCGCVFVEIQRSTSFEQFKELDNLAKRGEVTDEVISENYPWLIDSTSACY